jgi:hypothetical protein
VATGSARAQRSPISRRVAKKCLPKKPGRTGQQHAHCDARYSPAMAEKTANWVRNCRSTECSLRIHSRADAPIPANRRIVQDHTQWR